MKLSKDQIVNCLFAAFSGMKVSDFDTTLSSAVSFSISGIRLVVAQNGEVSTFHASPSPSTVLIAQLCNRVLQPILEAELDKAKAKTKPKAESEPNGVTEEASETT